MILRIEGLGLCEKAVPPQLRHPSPESLPQDLRRHLRLKFLHSGVSAACLVFSVIVLHSVVSTVCLVFSTLFFDSGVSTESLVSSSAIVLNEVLSKLRAKPQLSPS